MRTAVFLSVIVMALACLVDAGHGQDVKAVISGPATAAVGDLVILDATQSRGQAFRWLLLNSSKSFLPVENGRLVVFASGVAQEYVFVLVAAGCGPNGNVAVDVAEHRIALHGLIPAPPPPSTPELPPGRYGFAQAAYSWLFAVVPPDRRGAAGKLADNFEAVSAAIWAGSLDSLSDSEAIRQATARLQEANRKTLHYVDESNPGDTSAWREFFARWQAKADQHNPPSTSQPKGDGTLRSVKDYADAFRETTQGLRAAVAPAPTVTP